mgnify:FL=1
MGVKVQGKNIARPRREAKERSKEPLGQALYPTAVAAGLFVAIVFSALEMVDSAHRMRSLYQELDLVQRQQNELLAVHSRLLLERGARASLNEVEAAAEQDLGMHFPPLTESAP